MNQNDCWGCGAEATEDDGRCPSCAERRIETCLPCDGSGCDDCNWRGEVLSDVADCRKCGVAVPSWDCEVDGDRPVCEACAADAERPTHVNAYEVTRHYGGSEEGGWWYDAGEPVASVPMASEATPDEWARVEAMVTAAVAPLAHGDIGSVRGGAAVVVVRESHYATEWPATRPHYE